MPTPANSPANIPLLKEQVQPDSWGAPINPAAQLQAVDDVLEIDIQAVLGETPDTDYLELDADVLEPEAPHPNETPALSQTQELESLLHNSLQIEALEAAAQQLTPAPLSTATTPSSLEENPFLPAHLQEKLRQNKAVFLQEIQASTESVKASSELLKAGNQRNTKPSMRTTGEHFAQKNLIDALVAEFLPQIEAQLRKRLREQLDKNPT